MSRVMGIDLQLDVGGFVQVFILLLKLNSIN